MFASKSLEIECVVKFSNQRLSWVCRMDSCEMRVDLGLAIGCSGELSERGRHLEHAILIVPEAVLTEWLVASQS